MSAKLKALYELQSIDLLLAKAQKARASLDDGSSIKVKVEAAAKEAENAEKRLQESVTELRDKELNLKTLEGKAKAHRDRLYAGTITNPKELSSMEKEIEMLGRQSGKLEEQIIELMDILEERKSSAASSQVTLKQLEDELSAVQAKSKKENAVLVTKMRELLPEREKAVSSVDPVLMKKYEASRGRLGGIVVSKVDDGHCSGCRMQIGLAIMRELKVGHEDQICENCGRILYLEV